MLTYIYKAEDYSPVRRYNRTVTVYRVKNNKPIFVGSDNKISSASYKGDIAIANLIISAVDGAKMKNGYDLLSKNIQLFQV